AILGILALIAVPRLAGTTRKADISAHNANVRSLESAATMYIAENTNIKEDVEWAGGDGEGWEEYVQEWPKVPESIDGDEYKVIISKDGAIEVLPPKVDE
ncbi:MAG TPA: prepilin-type cleavage/methylation domain-containing protein, partial [Tissierellales bacterium]|nr:prepilin-type cleavage/methylation domain-containing protein [Tissierellales bacterium]